VAIGAGWQSIVAYVNLGCYYIIGIPVGIVLGNVLDMQVKVHALSPIFVAFKLLIMFMLLDELKNFFTFAGNLDWNVVWNIHSNNSANCNHIQN